MAFTGDLEQLHIADIIQLIHTTRKSGTFSVKGQRGESRIIFSNGYIVGASHLNGRIRIGSVLVGLKSITLQDLKQALAIQKKAGKDRRPLLSTLIQMGRIRHEDAFKGLRKLIEITIVELMGWTGGTFTMDPEEIAVSPECRYDPGAMEQEMSLDGQMVLMDALRVFDERERDRMSGREVAPYEDSFSEALPEDVPPAPVITAPLITPDILGLSDLDHLEDKTPKPASIIETFDPAAIHRQKVREALADFPAEDQEALGSYLVASAQQIGSQDASTRKEGRSGALVLFSSDELLRHAVMTICKKDGVMVFATGAEAELDRIMVQCAAIGIVPILVFDHPSDSGLTAEGAALLRRKMRQSYAHAPLLQLAHGEYDFSLEAYHDGVQAVIPRPDRQGGKGTFVKELIAFLESLQAYTGGIRLQGGIPVLREQMAGMRGLDDPADIYSALLRAVSGFFDRAILFEVKGPELSFSGAAGWEGPPGLKVPLTGYSVFRDVVETGQVFCGETDDEVMGRLLFAAIGPPLVPSVLLLPLKRSGNVVALVYADFGGREAAAAPVELLDMFAQHAGLVLENAVYRRQIRKTVR